MPLGLALLGISCGKARGQDLSQGIAAWAEASVGRSSVRWAGQRVAAPEPTARPTSLGAIDSETWPLRIHITGAVSATRLALAQDVLARAEGTYALLEAGGLFAARSEPAPGHSAWRDLYLVEHGSTGAVRDDTEVVADLDAASAFALFATRTPASMRSACVAEALIDAELLEVDPAESEVVRKASARYFAELVSGEVCEGGTASTLSHDSRGVLHDADQLAHWFHALGARQDRNRGVFMENMWQFARQLTWEGSGLRGSPDLFEAIAKALELSQDKLEEIAGQLSNESALDALSGSPAEQTQRTLFSQLPAHLPASAPLDVLDSSAQLIDLEGARPGTRLTIWARGEFGVRWALSATRLDARGRVLATVNAPVHKNPDTELTLELDADTHFVLASATNLGSGLPDPDLATRPQNVRAVRLIVARAD